jgi:uncharacterized membrane protein
LYVICRSVSLIFDLFLVFFKKKKKDYLLDGLKKKEKTNQIKEINQKKYEDEEE